MAEVLPDPVDRASAPHYRWGDRGDGWHLVHHQFLSVIAERMLGGELTIQREGAVTVLPPGTGLRVPPGVGHEVRNTGLADAEFLVISQPPSHGDREE